MTSETLINELKLQGVLKNKKIETALRKVDRADFVLPEYKNEAYENRPLPIGHGQTISQPYTVIFMLELLEAKKGDKVLDVGAGSGWTTALLAEIVGSDGKVYGVERISRLVSFGKENLRKHKYKQASIGQADDALGFSEKAPFDKILVSAAAKDIPKELVDQLKPGGVLVLPVDQNITKVTKATETDLEIEKYNGFRFVPLIAG